MLVAEKEVVVEVFFNRFDCKDCSNRLAAVDLG